jgi:predicted dehydrogenase
MKEKLRCAVVGLGRIGSMLEEDSLREKPCTHAGAIHACPDAQLVGGCDIDEQRRLAFSRTWNNVPVFDDINKLLVSLQPHMLSVATPPETHLGIIESALHSSVRLVICEKPLAPQSMEASEIARFHEDGLLKIMTNHERRYSEDYVNVKRCIDSGRFGRLLSISSKVYMGERRPVLQTMLDDGTHLIDTLRYLTASELTDIRAEFTDGNPAQTLYVRCNAGSIPVSMELGSGRDHVLFELDLSFSSGRIRIGNGLYEEHVSGSSPYYERMKSLLPQSETVFHKTGFFENMFRDAVVCARDAVREPRGTAVDGLRSIQFIDRVRELAGMYEQVPCESCAPL